ncbi:MAG: D-alanine--D-alanine ligase [Desulfovibrionales bacterium GWA2_65_9]|nr:MAG: D-alanine--D-alanine ligase [Desulfovibrionales bacterium GWA2_65_9]
MIVGLVYDLRSEYLAQGYSEEETAEFDKEDTIEALALALTSLDFAVERVGSAKSLVRALAEGRRWDLVFNIAEGVFGLGREALVPALLDAYRIPYTFSDPLVMALCLDKAACKRFVRDLGLPTPDFALVRTEKDIAHVRLPYPVFAKPVAEGTGKGVSAASRAGGRKQLTAICRALLKRFQQPVLVEQYLPGREFTVGIVGTGELARAVGIMEVVLSGSAEPGAYSYTNKANFEEVVEYLPVDDESATEAQDLALAVWRGLGCRDGGRVDIRLDAAGKASFLEVNPLAGLNPTISDLPILCRMNGILYQDLLRMIMQSALERLPRTPDKERRVRS